MRKLIVLLVSLTGCSLYWHGGGDDCAYGADDIAANELRDPQTGQCQTFGGGGGGNCGCAPCPEALPPAPEWPECFGACSGLGESACLLTAGCHTAYLSNPSEGSARPFWGCWDMTTETGVPPHTTGACNTLDAFSCAFRDDCASIFDASTTPEQTVSATYQLCLPEPTTTGCTGVDCSPGSHCEQQCTSGTCQAFCVPDSLCDGVVCPTGSTCVETCDSTGSCGTCTSSCVPIQQCEALATEAACKARVDCEPVYAGFNCTCTPMGCTCESETYERCQTLPKPG